MKRTISVLIVSFAMLSLLVACGQKSSAELTPEQEKAQKTIGYVTAGDFETLAGCFPKEVQENMTGKAWEEAINPLVGDAGQYGNFVEFLGVSQSSKTEEGIGEVTTVFQEAKYEKSKVIWQVGIMENGEINALFIRPA